MHDCPRPHLTCLHTFLELAPASAPTSTPLDPCRFTLDESVLHKGAALHASWAVEFLKQAQKAEVGGKEEL